jgi:hypothetical protein
MSLNDNVLAVYILWFRSQFYTRTTVEEARVFLEPRLKVNPPSDFNVRESIKWWTLLSPKEQRELSIQYHAIPLDKVA